MAQSFYPFSNSPILDAGQWSKMAKYWADTSVIKGQLNELQVYADSTGMQVKVKSGQAFMQGHFYESSAEEVLSIGAAPSTNSRIDRVVVRLDWVANNIQLAVIQGTAAASPTAPALTQNSSRWEISLAQITVGTNVATITAGSVKDERFTSGFVTPTLLNGWVANNSAGYPPRYWKEGNTVHYRLALTGGGLSVNTVVMSFPAGYRPSDAEYQVGYCDAGGQASADHVIYHVNSSGEVKFLRTITGNSLLILNGSFKAVN
jgi:hypothetical protein